MHKSKFAGASRGWLIGAQVDGEVESFEKITVDELIDRLVRDDDAWKPNVGLVLTDFLVRHGRVPADDGVLIRHLRTFGRLRNGYRVHADPQKF